MDAIVRTAGCSTGREVSSRCQHPEAGPPPGTEATLFGWQTGREFVWFFGSGWPGQGRPRGRPWALGGTGQRCPGPDALPDRVRPLGRLGTLFPSGGLDRQGLGFGRWMPSVPRASGGTGRRGCVRSAPDLSCGLFETGSRRGGKAVGIWAHWSLGVGCYRRWVQLGAGCPGRRPRLRRAPNLQYGLLRGLRVYWQELVAIGGPFFLGVGRWVVLRRWALGPLGVGWSRAASNGPTTTISCVQPRNSV